MCVGTISKIPIVCRPVGCPLSIRFVWYFLRSRESGQSEIKFKEQRPQTTTEKLH